MHQLSYIEYTKKIINNENKICSQMFENKSSERDWDFVYYIVNVTRWFHLIYVKIN